MPTLDWIGKNSVLNHHREVPFHLLEEVPELSVGDPDSGNLLVQGDNLRALKALLPSSERHIVTMAGIISIAGILSCSSTFDPPAGHDDIVIQSLLIVGRSPQVLWVERSTPADSVATPDVRPVPASEVALFLVLPDSSRVPFTPVVGSPGQFETDEAIIAGENYLLEGSVLGTPISAWATMPVTFTLTEPAQARDVFPQGEPLLFEWGSQGASGVLLFGQVFGQGRSFPVTDFSAGDRMLFNFLGISSSDSLDLDFFALERAAASFYDPTLDGGVGASAGNISGAEGFFGGAIVVHRRLIAQ